MSIELLLVLAGALAGGLVLGLTGFGTGITALVFWLHAVPPVVAGPLVVVCSLIGQVQTLPKIWHAINLRRVAPFIVGGLLGVPIGTLLLAHVSVAAFKFCVGVLLVSYCSYMLLARVQTRIAWGGRAVDALVGFIGGILGGLAGISAPPVTVWTGLRDWSRDARRAVLQAFNTTILSFALLSQLVAGFMTVELLKATLVALPGTLLGTWLGRRAYDRLSDARFAQVVLVVLLISGTMLIVSALH
jgi:hypothetical protein